MSIDFTALKNEINNDPASVGYKTDNTWKSDQAIVDLMKTTTSPVLIPLEINQFIRWCARHDSIRRLKAQETTSGTIGSICTAAGVLINSPGSRPLDFNDVEIKAMFDALVTAGVFTQAEETDLLNIATIQKSRADILGMTELGAGDVAKARGV